jgi:hypothetical protein
MSIATRFADKIKFAAKDDCWEWQAGKRPNGYGQFRVEHRNLLPHRVSWQAFNGPIPDGMCVLHKCDNPGCVNPNHLFLGTHQDNTRDMMRKGRGNVGLYDGEIWLLRKLRKNGVSPEAIGKMFNITRWTVWNYCRKEVTN